MLTVFILIILGVGIFPLIIYLVKTMQRQPSPEAAGSPLDAGWVLSAKGEVAKDWWERLRGRFNRHLFLGGIFSIALYYSLIFSELGRYSDLNFNFSIWHFVFVCALYIIYMGIANLLYNVGQMAEQIRKPMYPAEYRQKAYRWIALIGTIAPFIFIVLTTFL